MGALRDSNARLPFAVLSAAGLGLVAPAHSEAADFTVTNLGDSGPGSLRDAIDAANATAASDRILFQSGLSGNIDLTSGALYSYRPIEIDGPGGDRIRVRGDGQGPVIAFATNPGDDVSVDGLGFRGGFGTIGGNVLSIDADLTLTDVSSKNGGGLIGGGVATSGGSFTMRNSTVSGNYAYASAGGVYVCSDGKVTIDGSEISDNEAQLGGGGSLCSQGRVTITDSVVSGNQATSGVGGLYLGSDAGATVRGSTIAGNDAGDGCACPSYGGGLVTHGTDLTIDDSTISGNSAGVAGAIYAYDANLIVGDTTIYANTAPFAGGGVLVAESQPGESSALFRATTVTGNSSANSGGLANYASAPIGLGSSIVARNEAPGAPNLNGGFVGDRNVIGDAEGGTLTGAGNQLDVADPRLGPLADNGGPTETVLPAQDSPAIDAGDPALDGSRDQRGIVRADTDAGAVEAAVCEGVPVNRIGTSDDDDLEGTNGPDGILGFGGDDAIASRNGADGVCAGKGDDAVDAGNGSDAVLGNRGDDAIEGTNGPDDLSGGGGEDAIGGGGATDAVQGGNGPDDLGGGAGDGDQVLGGNAGDLLAGGSGADDLCDGQRGRNRAKPNCDIVRNARPVGGAAADAGDAVERGLGESDATHTDGTEETDEAADALELGDPEAVRAGGAAAE